MSKKRESKATMRWALSRWIDYTEIAREYLEWLKMNDFVRHKRKSIDAKVREAERIANEERKKLRDLRKESDRLKEKEKIFEDEMKSLDKSNRNLRMKLSKAESYREKLKLTLKLEQRKSDARRASVAPWSRTDSNTSEEASRSSKYSMRTVRRHVVKDQWECPVCTDVGDADRYCDRYRYTLKRLFNRFAVSSATTNRSRLVKTHWMDLLKEIHVVPQMIPRRIAVDVWRSHASEDAVLGLSLGYREFLRALVAASMIFDNRRGQSSSKSLSSKNLRRMSYVHQFLSFLCHVNKKKMRFEGAEEALRLLTTESDATTTRREGTLRRETRQRSEGAILLAARAANSVASGLGNPLARKLSRLVKYLPDAIRSLPEHILAGLYRLFLQRRARFLERFDGDDHLITCASFQGIVRDGGLLCFRFNAQAAKRVFQRFAEEVDQAKNTRALSFGGFSRSLMHLSKVLFPAEAHTLAFHRVVTKLLNVPLHVKYDENACVAYVGSQETRRAVVSKSDDRKSRRREASSYGFSTDDYIGSFGSPDANASATDVLNSIVSLRSWVEKISCD